MTNGQQQGPAWHRWAYGHGPPNDFYDDPNAPEVNSRVPPSTWSLSIRLAVSLMIRRSDNGNSALPGSAIGLGASIPNAGIRGTVEETGVTCEITGVIGTYTDPKYVIPYASSGEFRQEFSIVLTGRLVSGEPATSDESLEVRWGPRDELLALQMMQMRVEHYLSGASPYVG